MAIPRQGSVWDERRNTSQNRPGTGTAADALKAMARWRDEHPAHAAWIAAGAPPIHTEADHVAWFGESYEAARKPR